MVQGALVFLLEVDLSGINGCHFHRTVGALESGVERNGPVITMSICNSSTIFSSSNTEATLQ